MAAKKNAGEESGRVKKAPKKVLDQFQEKFSPRQISSGFYQIDLSSWRDFTEVIHSRGLHRNTLLYRGHTRADWPLTPSLFRDTASVKDAANRERLQLRQFRMAARGRCRLEVSASDEQWWALGQHMGLRTPLLDWSASPFVALFFAFSEQREENDNTPRAVLVLDRRLVRNRCKEIEKEEGGVERIVQFVEPFSHENTRIVGQAGLFTMTPPGLSLEAWVDKEFRKNADKMVLIKILVPSDRKDREDCLRSLNRMNINYLSLFPDLDGSARHCNLAREMNAYSGVGGGGRRGERKLEKGMIKGWRCGRVLAVVGVIAAVVGGVAWHKGYLTPLGLHRPANSIVVLTPYRYGGTWVFDDASVGLYREPFVSGIPEMMDEMVKDIPDAEQGFRLLFSTRPFPGYTHKLVWRRGDESGNWYYSEQHQKEGWLCPALFQYYQAAPKELYVKAEKK